MNRLGVNLVFFFIFNLNFGNVFNIKITELKIPKVADPRYNLVLSCKYDMSGQKLYSVKWYKDEQEFYRYIPSAKNNKNRFFSVLGVHPMHTDCTAQRCDVTIDQLTTTHSSGAYRCEVSLDAPTFAIAIETHNLTVAVLGEDNPYISGTSTTYQIGDLITANCTSDASNPPTTLTWYVNDKQIPTNSRRYPTEDGLTKTSASLVFYAENKYFPSPSYTLQMRCVATSPAVPTFKRSTTVNSTLSMPKVNNQKLTFNKGMMVTSSGFWIYFLFPLITMKFL